MFENCKTDPKLAQFFLFVLAVHLHKIAILGGLNRKLLKTGLKVQVFSSVHLDPKPEVQVQPKTWGQLHKLTNYVKTVS